LSAPPAGRFRGNARLRRRRARTIDPHAHAPSTRTRTHHRGARSRYAHAAALRLIYAHAAALRLIYVHAARFVCGFGCYDDQNYRQNHLGVPDRRPSLRWDHTSAISHTKYALWRRLP
jgi:hypothetical protein